MPRQRKSSKGFSMVELLVALAFTGILMAGMSVVFKSSLTTFYTSAEGLSAARRNRASMDLLYEDINSIGLYLQDVQSPPAQLSASTPLFYILPYQKIGNAAPDGPQFADQIFFVLDQPYPFAGSLYAVGTTESLSQAVQKGTSLSSYKSGTANSITVDCLDPVNADLVVSNKAMGLPLNAILQCNFTQHPVVAATRGEGNTVVLSTGDSPNVSVTGVGADALPSKTPPVTGTNVTLFIPNQMIRYSVQMLQLDPRSAAGVPCLVRDQGTYSAAGFAPNASLQQIITENVSDFQVKLSANPALLASLHKQPWAPPDQTDPKKNYFSSPPSFDDGWTKGILAMLNDQLTSVGRQGQTSTAGNATWWRDIPVVVRVDLTTRTATKRSEYYDPKNSTTPSDYKFYKRTFAMVPRHFGLPF
jgi:hypothetical protein